MVEFFAYMLVFFVGLFFLGKSLEKRRIAALQRKLEIVYFAQVGQKTWGGWRFQREGHIVTVKRSGKISRIKKGFLKHEKLMSQSELRFAQDLAYLYTHGQKLKANFLELRHFVASSALKFI